MVKSEIILKLSEKVHQKLKKSQLEKIIKVITDTVVQQIKYKKATEIRQFGRFSEKKIRERMNARNPRTGEKIQTKNKTSIAFKMSKELKIKINMDERSLI